jgi:hypothetical protein
LPSVSVGTTPKKIVNANRNRTGLSINNIDGNNAIFLLDNITESTSTGAIQLTGGQTRNYNITSAVVGTNQDGTPRFSGQKKVTGAHYAVASSGTQTVHYEEEWGGSQ